MNICVYGASSTQLDSKYIEAGETLGELMGKRGHTLIFGGGTNGMMGAVARGVFANGGRIIGIAPAFFPVDGILYEHCDELIRPDDMRTRKRMMEDTSDAFVVTPGGIGTFDEFFEIMTLRQLGRTPKRIAILNVDHYFDPLIALLQNAVDQHFMRESRGILYEVFDDPEKLLDYLETTPAGIAAPDTTKLI